jgi:hypothetical protein
MTRDETESNKDISLLFEGIPGLDPMAGPIPKTERSSASQFVDLNAEASPAVLSGLLNCNVSLIYQMRQDGKLPPNSNATYRECIHHYLTYWRGRASKKASNMAELLAQQEYELKRVKTEREWLAVKKEKGELLDIQVLAEQLEPVFLQLRTQLVALARRYPVVIEDVDKILDGWDKAGQEMFKIAEAELQTFIEERMNEKPEVEEKEEQEKSND